MGAPIFETERDKDRYGNPIGLGHGLIVYGTGSGAVEVVVARESTVGWYLSATEAEALCRALAEHLGLELAPKGWRATEYSRFREDGLADARVCQAMSFVGDRKGDFDGQWFVNTAPKIHGYQRRETLAECIVVVEALSRDTTTEPEP